jgi:GAF domain-containing protein
MVCADFYDLCALLDDPSRERIDMDGGRRPFGLQSRHECCYLFDVCSGMIMRPDERRARYAEIAGEIAAVIDGETNIVARMATVSNLLHHAFDHYFWTGFYLVDPDKPDELVIGPYQGTLGCLRIPFGRGVCGACAARGETVIVDDVHEFPGHIACDSRSESEIVVPVFDRSGALIAVLDVDSDRKAMFGAEDRKGLEAIVNAAFG